MIPYDIDPSLHAAEPDSQLLEDGFSMPRANGGDAIVPRHTECSHSLEDALASKSEF